MRGQVTWEVIFTSEAGEFRWRGKATDEFDARTQTEEALPFISLVRGFDAATVWDYLKAVPLESLEERLCPRCGLIFMAPLPKNNVHCGPCKIADPHQHYKRHRKAS